MPGQASSVTKSSHGGSDHRFLPGQVPAPAQACSFLSKGQCLPDASLSPWLHIEDNMPLKCQSSPSPDPATRNRDHTILIAILFRTPSLCAVNVHYLYPTEKRYAPLSFALPDPRDFPALLSPPPSFTTKGFHALPSHHVFSFDSKCIK